MIHKRLGAIVELNDNAIENYGEQYRDVKLKVTHVARNTDEHRGYDEGVSPQALYDLQRVDTKEDLHFSVYDYELR